MSLLLALVLSQSMNLNNQPLLCMDEGAYCRADRLRAFELNCSGAGISCAQTGGRMTVTVSGGGGGSSPSVTCGAGEALSWNGTTWLCVSTISTASALASDPTACSAGQYVTDVAASGTLTCAAPSAGDIATGTLSQARGGTGAGALTCVSGDFITSNGTTYSCSTPSGSGGGLTAAQVQRLVAIGGP